ncbi:MAG: hypothetical protein JXA67_15280 [Micromonosporaceae bacterium]|nr:hypothetical protein [Micromonosporaceae bacterium]
MSDSDPDLNSDSDLDSSSAPGSSPGSDPPLYGLGLLLAAARAPAWAEELAGEKEAVTRLVEARRVALSDHPVRSHDAQGSTARKTVVVRLAATLASLLVVGAIVAAETGSLPDPVQQRAHDLFSLLGVPAPSTGRQPGRDPSGGVDPTPTAPSPTPTPEPNPTATGTLDPSADQVRALCQAWNEAGRDPNGATMENQAWRTLVALAGGRARVPGLCAAFFAAESATASSVPPTSHPGGGPANPSRTAGGNKKNGWS